MNRVLKSSERSPRLRLGVLAAALAASVLPCSATAAPRLTTLASFNRTNGRSPFCGLTVDASGDLYGTTSGGGSTNDGTVFELPAGSNAVTTLVTFTGTNGASPEAGLVADASGNLYGTTFGGGSANDGTVFELAAGSRALTTLATFVSTNGANPEAGLTVDAAGNLYGTTLNGGSPGFGTVFEVAAGNHTLTTLANFGYRTGQYPASALTADSAGNLYGTTSSGGSSSDGTVFEVTAGTHALTTLVNFNGTNGATPDAALLLDATGNFYGTTASGGTAGDGTVFEWAAATGAVTTIGTFDNTNGGGPEAPLISDRAGDLFGTTAGAGANSFGTVYEVAAGTRTLTTLAAFNVANGQAPLGPVVADAAGNLYGTTSVGGPSAAGTVFELTGTGFATNVPEPTATALVLTSGLALGGRRRRVGRRDGSRSI